MTYNLINYTYVMNTSKKRTGLIELLDTEYKGFCKEVNSERTRGQEPFLKPQPPQPETDMYK